MANRMGFKFKRAYTTNQDCRSEDAKLVERIIAMRDIGLNRSQVTRQIEVSYQKFHRLLREYQIDFPKASDGGYARQAGT
jgi:hypothetical protein